jgi:hypothetical protein
MRISKDDWVPDESQSAMSDREAVWGWGTLPGAESVMFVEPMTIPWGDFLTVNVRLWFPDPPDDPPKRGARTEFLDFETVRVTVVVTTTIRHLDLEGP